MPHRGTSNEYPQHMFSCRNKKKYLPDIPSYLDLCIFFLFLQGTSNEYPQFMFSLRNKKKNIYQLLSPSSHPPPFRTCDISHTMRISFYPAQSTCYDDFWDNFLHSSKKNVYRWKSLALSLWRKLFHIFYEYPSDLCNKSSATNCASVGPARPVISHCLRLNK